ncbi:MAG: YfcC family protein [Erysipelotrichaceae bacterium]|nr:YfcC family protein [Erysipelotrichaceae bacterium]
MYMNIVKETYMSKSDKLNVKVKIGLKSFITVIAILILVLVFVGILTYVIPAGRYTIYTTDASKIGEPFYQYTTDESLNKQIVIDSYRVLTNAENTSRIPFYRWLISPIEALLFGSSSSNMIMIIALLLVLGGTFKVLETSGGLVSLVRVIMERLKSKRFAAIWAITAVIMVLSAVFGLQEQLLILFPIFAMLCTVLNWSNFTAISFILIASGVGFTTAITNPLTIGTASLAAGVNVTDGMWYRCIIFGVMYVITSMFLVYLAKKDEKKAVEKFDSEEFIMVSEEEHKEDIKKSKMIITLFSIALLSVIITTSIKSLRSLAMVFMAVAFIVGTVIIGRILLGSYKNLFKNFLKGVVDVLPSILIIMIAFGITYIAEQGNILHTIFYYFYNSVTNMSPYLAVIILYVFVLIIEFFIPSASAKAVLIIPMLTLAPIDGISKTVIILTYLFADGYTNVLYPTCGTLLVGLGLANVSFAEWFKKTILFQLLLMVLSIGFLMFAVFIGL